MFSVCITGHRPDKLSGGYDIYNSENKRIVYDIQKILLRLLSKNGYIHCITGMALGADQLFAIAVIGLMQSGYHIDLEAAIPCFDQDKLWSKESKELYKSLLAECTKITYVSEKPYFDGCMRIRNEYMVDNSDFIIAVYDGVSEGGTKQAIDYGKNKHKVIEYIDN